MLQLETEEANSPTQKHHHEFPGILLRVQFGKIVYIAVDPDYN